MQYTCTHCGHMGKKNDFINGVKGRKIHDECNKCRSEYTSLIHQQQALLKYLTSYRDALSAIMLQGEALERFNRSRTPTYLSDQDSHYGTLHDPYFVPIKNLAYEHALKDLSNNIDLREEVEKNLGNIVTPGTKIDLTKPTRDEIRASIKKYSSVPTGILLSQSPDTKAKNETALKALYNRIFKRH